MCVFGVRYKNISVRHCRPWLSPSSQPSSTYVRGSACGGSACAWMAMSEPGGAFTFVHCGRLHDQQSEGANRKCSAATGEGVPGLQAVAAAGLPGHRVQKHAHEEGHRARGALPAAGHRPCGMCVVDLSVVCYHAAVCTVQGCTQRPEHLASDRGSSTQQGVSAPAAVPDRW